MSGTSLDGVDAVLADFAGDQLRVLGHCSTPLPEALRAELLALNSPGPDELHRAALAANALVRVYASQVHRLLAQCGVHAQDVLAIGAHGQTVRHRPQEFDGTGYTLQLNNPALLAELCAIPVVADFRSRDVAAGGQGAPLVPPFHRAVFGNPTQTQAVLNLGGMANLSILFPGEADTLGFDCGPGNALMDAWCLEHTSQAFDDGGAWAATGVASNALLERLLATDFFHLPPPKSTGRDLFHRPWLDAHLQGLELAPQDVQATLAALTAQVCAEALQAQAPGCTRLIVCGGGALNTHLMARLQTLLAPCPVLPSDAFGLPALQVEACAFAWLAQRRLQLQTGSLPKVTGAKGARVLGALYAA